MLFKILPDQVLKYVPFYVGSVEGEALSGTLLNPFLSGKNVHYLAAKAHMEHWVLEHGLFEAGSRAYQTFCKADFSKLCAYCYRQEDVEGLCLETDFVAWLFCHDDFRDSNANSIGGNPTEIEQMNLILKNILATGRLNTLNSPLVSEYPKIRSLAKGLQNIRNRLIVLARDGDISNFVKSMDAYFQANKWEAQNRKAHRVPTVHDYVDWRRHTSAVLPTLEIALIVRGIDLDPSVRASVVFNGLVQKACDVVCFTNDIFSVIKELRDGLVENLVIVIKKDRECTWQRAAAESQKMCDAGVKFYLELKTDAGETLLKSGTGEYCELMEHWMKGNLDWSRETLRYYEPTAKL